MPRNTGKVTVHDMIECCARELRKRHQVYPRQVKREQMTQAEASWQLECMLQTHRYLQEKALGDIEAPAWKQEELFTGRETYYG